MMMNWAAFTAKQKKMMIGAAVLVVVQIGLMAYALGWMKPAAQRGGAVRSETDGLHRKIDEAQMVLRGEQSVREQLAETVQRMEELKRDVPASADRYAWAYEYISRRAADAGVTLDNVEDLAFRGGTRGREAPKHYEVSVTARCGYSRLVDFLWRIERDNRLLSIRSITVSASAGDPLHHQVRFVVQWPSELVIERGEL